MSLGVTSATMLGGLPKKDANTGEQSWEGKQHRILTGSLEHLNSILPKVSVN